MHDRDHIRVVTQNVWARHGDWPRRRALLRDGLRSANPDLAVFVEAVKTEDYDLVEDLLGPGYEIVYESRLDRQGVGLALASRWPIPRVHELGLEVTDRTARLDDAALAAEIVAPAPIGPLLFIAANPKWEMRYERERELQALTAARFAEHHAQEHGAHVVLAGDFDAVPAAASIRFLSGLQSLDGVSVCYRDAWASAHPADPGHTFTPSNPLVRDGETAWDVPRRIDYVFVRCDNHGPTLNVRSCERLFDQARDGVWASDHFGVMADLSVNYRQ
jgi:endonuclease/exonuclease/phosphatase family metal-dependent hydrolase